MDAAWGPVEDQIRVPGVTHEDIVKALGRHVSCYGAAGEPNGEEAAVAQPEQAAVGGEAETVAVRAAGGANGEEAAVAQPEQAAAGDESETVAVLKCCW